MKNNEHDVNEYLMQLKGGNMSALALLYDVTCKQLYALCYAYLKNRADSEDALIDAYVKIQKNIDSFNGKSGFSWAYTLTKNVCLNLIKKRSRETIIDFYDEKNSAVLAGLANSVEIEDDFEQSDIVILSKKILSEEEFRVVILHAVNQEKFKTISKIVGVKESTVRWQYNNALKKIRQKLKEKKLKN